MCSAWERTARRRKAAAVSVAFARLAAALKLPGVSHHTFRHTGATVMVANGVSLRAVQMIGGWTSLRMVERYAHLDDAELQRAVRLTHNHAEAAKQGGQKGIRRPERPVENLKMRMARNREGSGNYRLASPRGFVNPWTLELFGKMRRVA